jgi:hypothetical protein
MSMFKKGLILVLTEVSYSYIQYWRYDDCEAAIFEALEISGIQIDLAGKLGRLTKWQQFDIA